MKNFLVCLAAFFFSTANSFGQTLADAARYSVLEVGGTARTVGVGGAMGAIGADFSTLSVNPAGLGTYRRSEFVFSPTIEIINSDFRLDGSSEAAQNDKRTNFNFNALGLVFVAQPLDSKWRNTQFALGINRLATFHQNANFEGMTEGSITDRWLELAQGKTSDQLGGFEEGLAFNAEAIYRPDPDDERTYASDFIPSDLVKKTQRIERKGSFYELVFSLAGNYADKLMIGGTLGVPLVNFEEKKTYQETDESDLIPVFDRLTYRENLSTDGAGINLKLGLIYRLNQMFRLGLAVHSPTSLSLDDTFDTGLDYVYTLDGSTPPGEQVSPDGEFQYRFRTPWRLIGSAGVILGKSGFLSADVEYLDYTAAKFNFKNATDSGDTEYEQELNDGIDQQFASSALNIRLGGEFALEQFRFRGGYSLMASPYDSGETNGALSLGFGIREENVFLDFAWRRALISGSYIPYATDVAAEPLVVSEEKRGKFMMTVGFKF